MRTLSTQARTLLTGKYAIEPIVIVEILWIDGGNTFMYADRDVPPNVLGRITAMSAFDNATTFGGEGQNTAVSITLSDVDGTIKAIFDNNDIHKRPVTIWQWFNGFDISDKFLISSGVICSPIVWDEGSRSLSFSVVSRLESFEIGFSAEEGWFPSIPQELVGTPWPMVFGTVVHSPALQLQDIPTGFTLAPFGVPDPNILPQVAKLTAHIKALRNAASAALIDAAFACATFEFNDPTAMARGIMGDPSADCNTLPEVQQFNQMSKQFQEEANTEQASINTLTLTYSSQLQWNNPPKIYVTTNITQPYTGQVRLGNQLFHAQLLPFQEPPADQSRITSPLPILFDPNAGLNPDGTPKQSLIQKAGFQFYNTGTQVSIAGPYPLFYMVSIVPGTVQAVWAFRSWNGTQQLSPVPTSWYTTTQLNFGAITAYGVTLTMPLSVQAFLQNLQTEVWENDFGSTMPPHIVNQVDWQDQIYVTFESSIGPNPVDIMEYLITTYSDLAIDSTTFDAVRTLLANYPMNFMIQDRPQLIDILNDLAYQSRCAIWIENDTFFIKYLPLQDDTVDTLTEDDIVPGTLKVTTSATEQLVTKYVATYRPDYSPEYETPVKLILRFNIAKYGYHQEQHDFFALNNYFAVEKTATFWMIRKSQTWKYLECKVLMHKINLETFDTVNLHFQKHYVANGDVPAMIESAVYDSNDNTIQLKLWVPVRAGEMEQFELAWPAGVTENTYWPVFRDLQSGTAGGIDGVVAGTLPLANSVSYQISSFRSGYFPEGYFTDNSVPFSLDELLGVFLPTSNDATLNPIPLEWGSPSPSDRKDTPIKFENETKRVVNAPPVDAPSFLYDFINTQDPNTPTLRLGTDVWPCVIQQFSGLVNNGEDQLQMYDVIVFKQGLQNAGTPLKAVIQLQLDQYDRIPSGTWTFVNVVRWSEGKSSDGSSTSTTGATGPDGGSAQPSKPDSSQDPKAITNQNYFTQCSIQLPVWLR